MSSATATTRATDLLDLISASCGDSRPLPQTLVVVAHPDDEVVALGGRLPRYRDALFAYATNGAPRNGLDATACGFAGPEEYRNARAKELAAAFALAGICSPQITELASADQMAAFHLEELSSQLAKLIREFRPQVVLTHPYEGGHPDHDACALAVACAVRAQRKGRILPVIVEAAFYHAGANGIETGCFLRSGAGSCCTQEVIRRLSPEENARRRALLDCFPTQRETLQYFRGDIERYRIAPAYDFSRPPHSGTLFYEWYPWGTTGVKFCELARRALQNCEALCA